MNTESTAKLHPAPDGKVILNLPDGSRVFGVARTDIGKGVWVVREPGAFRVFCAAGEMADVISVDEVTAPLREITEQVLDTLIATMAASQKQGAVSRKEKQARLSESRMDAVDFAALNHPTQDYLVTIRNLAGGRREERAQTKRRLTDARLWNSLGGWQQEAAELIEGIYRRAGRGLGYKPSNMEAGGGGGRSMAGEITQAERDAYWEWANECMKTLLRDGEGKPITFQPNRAIAPCALMLMHSACIDILALGKTAAEVDAERRIREGTAKMNLQQCLTVWCWQHGWVPRPANAR